MSQAASLNTIFSTQHGPAANICSFLCDMRLSPVSKAFARENARAMEQVALQLRGVFPGENIESLSAWNTHQKGASAVDGNHIAQFARFEQENAYSFAVERFERAATIVLSADQAKDEKLRRLWQSIRPALGAGAPANDGTAQEISEWIHDADPAELARITRVEINGYMPDEVRRFTGLRNISWSGGDLPQAALPEWFGDLQQLEQVDLSTHRFSEIPPVLERLPNLAHLSISRNQPPIRALPDALERQLHGFWEYGDNGIDWFDLVYDTNQVEWLIRAFGPPSIIRELDRRHHSHLPRFYLNLAPDQFTDIPFRAWFRETIRIPNIPMLVTMGLGYGFSLLLLCIEGREDLWWNCNHPFITTPLAIIFFATVLPLLLPLLAWSFINQSLNYALESVVTFIRDQMGYSRMVHVRDLPAAPQEVV